MLSFSKASAFDFTLLKTYNPDTRYHRRQTEKRGKDRKTLARGNKEAQNKMRSHERTLMAIRANMSPFVLQAKKEI